MPAAVEELNAADDTGLQRFFHRRGYLRRQEVEGFRAPGIGHEPNVAVILFERRTVPCGNVSVGRNLVGGLPPIRRTQRIPLPTCPTEAQWQARHGRDAVRDGFPEEAVNSVVALAPSAVTVAVT